MKILVTGASGFIGSHLAKRLVEEGHEVSALVREENLDKLAENRKDAIKTLRNLDLKVVKGDFLDRESLKRALSGIEVVFHLGAIARPMAIPNELYFKVNEEGTRNLFEAIDKKKIKKIVMMSSVSAVGVAKNGLAVNEKSKRIPVDVYGMSKLAQERVAEEFVKKGLPIVTLRPPMVFGPRDFEMLRLFRAVDRRFFPVFGRERCLEFLYVENLVEACFLAWKNGIKGEAYHISNGEHYSINQVVGAIEKAARKNVFPIKLPGFVFVLGGFLMEFLGKLFNFHPPFKHDTVKWMTQKVWYSDITKAKQELGYKPIFNLEEGVKETYQYYKENNYL